MINYPEKMPKESLEKEPCDKISISLSTQMTDKMDEKIKDGLYESRSEIIREALRAYFDW